MLMASPLTPATQLGTNVQFPIFRKEEGAEKPALCVSPDEKIQIESCAEYMQFDITGSKFGNSADFILLHDLEGQPMVLSIGTDRRLRLCLYVNGTLGSWTTFDINPTANFEALVCDASRSPNNKNILITVSGHESNDKLITKLYQIVIDCPKLIADDKGALQGYCFEEFSWSEIAMSISNRQIKTLVCEYFGGELQYQIVAGVAATTKEGSHFIYSPSKSKDWILVKFPQQVETIRSVVPANIPALGPGYIVLFEDNSTAKAVSCFFQGDGVSKQVYLTGLRNARRISTSVNKKGLSDILVAADNGIGFIDNNKMIEPPKILFQDIGCSTVLGSEFPRSKEESTLLIYAVSTHGELFVIEGSRKGKQVDFCSSTVSIPIRTGIRNIAGQINPLTGAFETVYVTNDDDSLRHLTRDPLTSLWNEANMIVKSTTPDQKVRTPCFLVTVTLTNGKGVPVPIGYQLQLSSSPTLVYINDRSYNLDRRPQTVPVNEFGQLQIVVPSSGSFGAAPISIKFMPDTGETKVFKIQPAQRVLHTLGKLRTGDDLRNAHSSDGRPLFSEVLKQKNAENFDQAAEIFSRVPLMVASTDADEEDIKKAGKTHKEMTVVWEKNPNGTSNTDKDWLTSAVDATGEILGDAIELLKTAVKSIVKVALKIAGPVIRLILKIGAKVIRFVLNSVSSIVTSLSYYLESIFDIDVSALRDFFSFRYQKVEATQKELASLIDNGLLLTSSYLHHNHDTLNECIDMLGSFLERNITRPYSAQELKKPESSASSLLNNPIISNLLKFNPLSWIMEAIAEETGDDVKIPTLDLNIGRQVFTALQKQLELLVGFIQRSWTSFQAAIGQPERVMDHLFTVFRDGFWTIFDSIKSIILAVYSLVMNSFDKIVDFCRGTWEIPSMTELWKDLTNTDFSLINFVSYVTAQVLELLNGSSKPVLENLGLSATLGNLAAKKIPSLLPRSMADELEAYSTASGGSSFDEQVMLSQSAQQQGSAHMAANPITQPKFGLMMANTANIDDKGKHYDISSRIPSDAIRHIVAFARSGKAISRSANVAIQGFMQGGSGSASKDQPGTRNQGSGDIETTPMLSSTSKIDLDDSFDIERRSTAGSLTDFRQSAGNLTSQKGIKTPSLSLKSILVGTNAFGFGCRVTELFLLLNYYSKDHQDAENFDGVVVETIASLVGLILCCFSDSLPIVAASNVLVSGGSFAGSCMAPQKDFFRISEMIGCGCSTLSSVLFLVKEPTCQTIAWGGVGVDAVNTALMISNQGWRADIPITNQGQDPPKGRDDVGSKPPTVPHKPGSDIKSGDRDKDKEKKKKTALVVTSLQDVAASGLRQEIYRAISAFRSCPNHIIFTTPVLTYEEFGENSESIISILTDLKIAISPIKYLQNFELANTSYQGQKNFVFTALGSKWKKGLEPPDSKADEAGIRVWQDHITKLVLANADLDGEMMKGGEEAFV